MHDSARNLSGLRALGRSWLAPVILLSALAAPNAVAQSLQFRTGDLVVGDVRQVTTAGFSFSRLDNGGVLQLTWDDLTVACAQRLKRMHGLIEENEDLYRIDADVLRVAPGGGGTIEIVGLLDTGDEKTVTMRRKGEEYVFNRRDIKGLSKRKVPVYEIYTEDGYYNEQLVEIEPGNEADKHVELAERLRRAGDVRRALQHLERAQELGGGRYASELTGRIAGVRRLAEAEDERRALSNIGVLINRKDYVAAAEAIESYAGEFPEPRLSAELKREERRLVRERTDYLTSQVTGKFETLSKKAAQAKLADERELTLAGAKAYAQGAMAADLWERMASVVSDRDVEVTPEEVVQLWTGRDRLENRSGRYYSYGIGSWVLGGDVIIKDTPIADAKAKQEDRSGAAGAERERDEVIARLRQLRERTQRAARANRKAQTDEEWWALAGRDQRIEWLQAYFVEFGSGAEIYSARAIDCYNCEGRGTIQELLPTGQPQNVACRVCHGTRYTRSFYAK